ncbi:substrate-binding domain-containing protein [Streptomyces sp. NBC_01716]|uniref:substrate-binding domain-containing protein n=1 Tax=Streptomyces sp. NBC_01716 TaxID=2975917 RepID=UPI002E35C08F|nr:substrate-binding domain-containing protein [Streptomyces sp. NBC_01716]
MGPGCNGEAAEARVTEAMIDRGTDGLVLIAPVSPRPHLEQLAHTVPTVVVGRHGQSAVYDTVSDDDTAGAALGPISLTSVDQAGRHIGTEAARLLLGRLADRGKPSAQVKLSPSLVVRRTTAPPSTW